MVTISFVYCSPKTIKCTQKPKIEKKFTGIDQSSERASERVPFSTSYLQPALAHARNSGVKKPIKFFIEALMILIGKALYNFFSLKLHYKIIMSRFQVNSCNRRNCLKESELSLDTCISNSWETQQSAVICSCSSTI